MTVELVLIRGLPGSGKSTLAKSLSDHMHVENDMYFEHGDDYRYEANRMRDAIEWCQDRAENALVQHHSAVVSNTFIKGFEWEPYVAMAKRVGVPIRFIEAKGSYKNIHRVPDHVVQRMRMQWEPLPADFQPDSVDNALFDMNARVKAGQEYPDALFVVSCNHRVACRDLESAYDAQFSMG